MKCAPAIAFVGALDWASYVCYAAQGAGGPKLYYNGSGPVPPEDMLSPIPTLIIPSNSKPIEEAFFTEIIAIVNTNNTYSTACEKCIAGLELAHLAAITQPISVVTDLLIEACNAIPAFQDTIYAKTCCEEFWGTGGLDPYYAQLLSKMSSATADMQVCAISTSILCDQPPTFEIDESLYF